MINTQLILTFYIRCKLLEIKMNQGIMERAANEPSCNKYHPAFFNNTYLSQNLRFIFTSLSSLESAFKYWPSAAAIATAESNERFPTGRFSTMRGRNADSALFWRDALVNLSRLFMVETKKVTSMFYQTIDSGATAENCSIQRSISVLT